MRITTLLRRLLGVSQTVVRRVRFDGDQLLVDVSPSWRKPRCGLCGQRAPGYDRPKERRWRDVALGGVVVWLVYHVRRVECATCGVRVERVPWAAHDSRFTLALEELGAFLARVTDKTTASTILGVSWRAVGGMVRRVVGDLLDPGRLDGLRRIGIDEFSYRKHHRYITVVVNHDTGKVVWAAEGKGSDTLHQFFDELGPERVAALETATIDMSAAYKSAIEQRAPHVQIIFDRFHVQRLASDAVDEVRREAWREQRGTPQGDAVKKSRWALLKKPWNLTRNQRDKLSEVQRTNKRLYRAYLLKETLGDALDYLQPWRARRQLDEWLAWASRSRLQPFVRVARTIRRHKEGILAYIDERLTNAVVEGTNNKLRMIARRAFGFHSAAALIAMLFLCCGGIVLQPPLPGSTH